MHDATVASGNAVTFSLGGDVVDLAERRRPRWP
jgi:hypothetical protein